MLRTVGMLRKTYSARKREKEKPESSPYAQCVQASPGKSMMSESREAVNRRTGSVCGTPSEAPVLPTAALTLRGRSVICPIFGQITLRPLSVRTQSAGASAAGAGPAGRPRSRGRRSGRFRRPQSWTSTIRKLLTWGYVAADSADHGGEPEKPPRTPEGRQIQARFPAKRPRTRGRGAREERSPSVRPPSPLFAPLPRSGIKHSRP